MHRYFRTGILLALLGSMVGLCAAENAICLDGESGCIYFGHIAPAYQSATVEVRCLWNEPPPPPTDPDNAAEIFYEGSGGEFTLSYGYEQGEPHLRFGVKMTDYHWHGIQAFSIVPWCDGEPHHIAAVYDGDLNEVRVYIDGENVASADVPDLGLYNPHFGMALGRYGHHDRKYAFGLFGELRFWERAVPPDELLEHMWTPLEGTEPGLVGYWKIDEGQGTVAYDSGPGAHDGEILGGADWCEYDLPSPATCTSWGVVKREFRNP